MNSNPCFCEPPLGALARRLPGFKKGLKNQQGGIFLPFIFSIILNNSLSRVGNDPFLLVSDNLIASNVAIKGPSIFEGIFKFIKSIYFGRVAGLHVQNSFGMTVVSIQVEAGQASAFHTIRGAATKRTAPAIWKNYKNFGNQGR